jgi:hypothetical protein
VSGQRIRPTTDDDREERMPRIDRDDAESLAGPRDTLCRAGTDGRTDGATGDSRDILSVSLGMSHLSL